MGFVIRKEVKALILVLVCLAIWGHVRSINSAIPPLPKPAPSSNTSTAPAILSEHDEAQEHAKSFILKTLKAPDSAKFPPYSEIRAVKVAGLWEVSTYVDAQNSFGAMIRTPYFLKMENQGALWRLAYIGQEREMAYIAPAEYKQSATTKDVAEKPVYRSVDKDGNPVFSDNQQ